MYGALKASQQPANASSGDLEKLERENLELTEKVVSLEESLLGKEKEVQKMEGMFKEYASWRQKLEVIEQKMKQEVDHWKD